MLDDRAGPLAASRASAGDPGELPDLRGSLPPATPTAMALLGAAPQELSLLAHRTHKSKAGSRGTAEPAPGVAHKAILKALKE